MDSFSTSVGHCRRDFNCLGTLGGLQSSGRTTCYGPPRSASSAAGPKFQAAVRIVCCDLSSGPVRQDLQFSTNVSIPLTSSLSDLARTRVCSSFVYRSKWGCLYDRFSAQRVNLLSDTITLVTLELGYFVARIRKKHRCETQQREHQQQSCDPA